ncbi:MAG: EF-hand domain-containing protein [Rhodospirillales bacterium]
MAGAAVCACFPTAAQTTAPPAVMEGPLRDPWLPPEARKPSGARATQGVELRKQVEQKLKLAFDAANPSRSGTLTRQQAQAAHLGLIARHFDEIDVNHTGVVQFEDVKRFLKQRGAQLD